MTFTLITVKLAEDQCSMASFTHLHDDDDDDNDKDDGGDVIGNLSKDVSNVNRK